MKALWMTLAVLVLGCDPGERARATTEETPIRDDDLGTLGAGADTPLRDRIERNAVFGDIAKKLGPERIDAPIGGGPPAAEDREYAWPFQARAQVAAARCAALAQCSNVDRALCVERETSRLGQWPGAACGPAEIRQCVESVRAGGCGDVEWALPAACAPARVCNTADTVVPF